MILWCCGAAAAAVNHSGTGLANESALEGPADRPRAVIQQRRPRPDDFILLLCFDKKQKKKKHGGVTRHKAASTVFNLTAMKDSPRHVAGMLGNGKLRGVLSGKIPSQRQHRRNQKQLTVCTQRRGLRFTVYSVVCVEALCQQRVLLEGEKCFSFFGLFCVFCGSP